MLWALLVLLVVLFAVHWYDYTRSVQEYTFAQPATPADLCSTLLNDKTPLVLEVGDLPWRPEVVSAASWVVQVENGPEMSAANWLSSCVGKEITNQSAFVAEMGLTKGLSDMDDARPFWWLPGFRNVTVGILHGAQEKLGLSWVTAERRWIGCSAGAPIVLWLVHSRHKKFLPSSSSSSSSVDPWSLTVAEAPYIQKVQFVEVRVRPGWCVGVPAHWGVAVRSDSQSDSDASSWWWMADQDSVLSLGLKR